MGFPRMSGSLPSRDHSEVEMTAPPASVNHCPSLGTPRFLASDGVMEAPERYCGSPGELRLKLSKRNHPKTSKLVVCAWYSLRSLGALELYRPGSLTLAPYSATKRSPPGYGTGLSSTPLITVKIAVAEPIPTVKATMARKATPFAPIHERHA